MKRTALLLLTLAVLTGCADRRLHITSDPPGALVALNDVEVGRTPVEVNFTSFGTYDVRLQRPGYATLLTSAEANPELHDQPVFDALSVFTPGRPRTDIYWHFVMEPLETDADALIERAREVRAMAPETPAPDSEAEPNAEPDDADHGAN